MSTTPPTPRPVTASEHRLETLERDVVKGEKALKERNRLVVSMFHKGHRQAELTRRLNRQRLIAKADPLTPDAIYMIIKRDEERKG